MIVQDIQGRLSELQDKRYLDFERSLIPNLEPGCFIGVRTPELRHLAKEMGRQDEIQVFLNTLPHTFFEENQLHAFIISEIRAYGRCLDQVNVFLPYVDNWATCDQMSPTVFAKHREELLTPVRQWLLSEQTYTMRFGIRMLMNHYLDEAFDPALPELVAGIRSEEYYVRMMVAWYFATALAKQYESVLPYLEEQRLEQWTHNRTIQKALESRRLSSEQKSYLRGLKIRA